MADLTDKLEQLDRDQEEQAVKHRALELHMRYANLRVMPLDNDVLKIIPLSQVEGLQCIALARDDKTLNVGVVEPTSTSVKQGLAELEQMTGLVLKVALISASSFAYGHKTYQLLVKENEGERPVVITEKQHQELADLVVRMRSGDKLVGVNVTDMLSSILADGVARLASDIHFEPTETGLAIRFRIDGVLHLEMLRSGQEYHGLVSRIKYLAKLPLKAATSPEDGRFTITVNSIALDLRVASLPTIYGDMITMRILRQDQVMRHLSDLGLRRDLEQIVTRQLTKPHGMIMVTGPTGSGKTTTLYALLQDLNTPERKIITIEDPVEYKLPGLEQSQVDPEGGYAFADALRGALRQDPDVIMVGEIRDQETASIGIRAALTGHVVLATMHANDAPSSYSRLLEMGVEPFLFSGSVNVIIAQRLVRLLCKDCKTSLAPSAEEATRLKTELGRVPSVVFEAKGCEKCGHIGYRGRIGIFEILEPSHAMEQMALMHSSVSAFQEQAAKDGMITLLQDGLLKVEQGVTSIAEIMRVTSD